MKFLFHTFTISPHQLPLAKGICEAASSNRDFRFLYVPDHDVGAERRSLGWNDEEYQWIVAGNDKAAARAHCEDADFLFSYLRTFDVFSKRAKVGKPTVYCSERWLKPLIGIGRLFLPSYWRMARQIVDLLSSDSAFYYFSIGIHAARDMARICGLMHGDLRCIFKAPELDFEHRPGGRIWLKDSSVDARKYCLDKMRMWGYFVEPSKNEAVNTSLVQNNTNATRVLWVGRLLKLKRVDTIIRAVGELAGKKTDHKITLDIYGVGPDEAHLKRIAAKYGEVIQFHPPVPIDEVRKLMRSHDIYVLSSNPYEGWGAVVSEALEEGMRVIASLDTGSGATLLPQERQFKSGDVKKLTALLNAEIKGRSPATTIDKWTASCAGKFLSGFAKELYNVNDR